MAGTDQLDVARIFGLHHPVVQVGDLPGAAGGVILDRAHDTDLVANGQNLQADAGQIVAVVDLHTVPQIGLGVIGLHIDRAVVVHGDHAVKGHLDAVVGFGVGTQLLDGQLHGIAVVEVRVFLAGKHIELQILCLVQGAHADAAILIVGGGGTDGQSFLQQLHIEVAVLGLTGIPVPDPGQMAASGGVGFPVFVLGFQHDGFGSGQLCFGKLRGLFAVFFDLAGGFRGIHCQKSGLEHAIRHHIRGNVEVDRVAVHMGLDSSLGLAGDGAHVQLKGSGIVHRVRRGRDGCRDGIGGRGGCRLIGTLIHRGDRFTRFGRSGTAAQQADQGQQRQDSVQGLHGDGA